MANPPNAPNHPNAPIPRLCVLTKLSGAEEYGFNLHAEMGRGQFVGAVDVGSAAQMADLRPGDHIVAVNGQSIEGLSHKEVVQRIKSNPIRCSLLVLDEEGVLWHKDNGMPISAEHILRRLNANKWEQNNEDVGVDVDVPPIPLPRKRNENRQISPSRTSDFGTDLESGSCSIALPLSTPGSPLSNPRVAEDTPLTLGEGGKKQKEKQSPPPSPNTTIGRHAAISVPPPATLLANGPKPRLCTLQKSSAIQEFGFNLHAERGKGHFIGAVDKNGIAEQAGLETGQRIVGVNGRLIFPNTPHKEIVQLIKRDPLCTELLVASEEVDRFYAEYGLAFTYDFVQIFERIHQNGIPAARNNARQGPSASQNGLANFGRPISRQNRNSSGSSASVDGRNGNRNGNQEASLRGRGNSLGQRPPTPTSTYSATPQNGLVLAVAVQIEQRPDNMTSIEIGELEEMPNSHRFIGIGTPPSSRCDEKSEKEEEGHSQGNGAAVGAKEEKKHVIADCGISPPPPSSAPIPPPAPNRLPINSPLPLQPLTIFPPNNQQSKKAPFSIPPSGIDSAKSQSRGSSFEKRDFGKDIFALNAKEARKAICGRKKDARLEGQMTLEEKHRLILDL